jgi:hypothetical protein
VLFYSLKRISKSDEVSAYLARSCYCKKNSADQLKELFKELEKPAKRPTSPPKRASTAPATAPPSFVPKNKKAGQRAKEGAANIKPLLNRKYNTRSYV